MRISILTPQKILYEGNAKEVMLPSQDEEIAVMDFHQTAFFALGKGDIRIKDEALTRIPVTLGLARVFGNELLVLVEAS